MMAAIALVLAGCSLLAFKFILRLLSPNPRKALPDEHCYFDSKSHHIKAIPFRSSCLEGNGTVTLSLVIPAYNEEERIEKMLQEAVQYLETRQRKSPSFSFEIIVVDDGCRDNTFEVVMKFSKSHPESNIKYLKLSENRGKGGAVTQGILHADGSLILFADADGSTTFSDFQKLEKSIVEDGYDVAFGSRSHLVTSEAVVKRSLIRNLLMRGFHLYLYLLGVGTIKDTQCGFKLFKRGIAAQIFPNIHVEGWIFDIEVLHIALSLGFRVSEVAVNWVEIDGSKVNIVRDSLKMAIDLLIIKLNYAFGIWKIKGKAH